ncbi:MAG: double zinc ribbon domain-containing protein [bacterium]|nr:double zinc ribbon domain-containing protein [bacterium]
MYKFFISFLRQLENNIFPGRCSVCHHAGPAICPACRASINRLPISCPLCGQASARGLICSECADGNNLSFDGLIAYASYEDAKLKSALHALKFQGTVDIGLLLGKMLGRRLLSIWPREESERPLLIPLPLHPRRKRERGYNQAQLIAAGVAAVTGWPLQGDALKRTRYQAPSSSLGYRHRQQQDKIFVYEGENINNQTVILIDDIITTGETASTAAQALKNGGAGTVVVATIARAG